MIKKLIVILMLTAWPSYAKEIKVVDGDSLIVEGKMTRLIGIDAPEFSQTCHNARNELYDCGFEAIKYLEELIEEGREKGFKIKCKKHDTDKYKRDLSICKMGNMNLNRLMVAGGHAIVYRHPWYEEDEIEAKNAKKGIWQGRFMRPELYRILQKYEKSQK